MKTKGHTHATTINLGEDSGVDAIEVPTQALLATDDGLEAREEEEEEEEDEDYEQEESDDEEEEEEEEEEEDNDEFDEDDDGELQDGDYHVGDVGDLLSGEHSEVQSESSEEGLPSGLPISSSAEESEDEEEGMQGAYGVVHAYRRIQRRPQKYSRLSPNPTPLEHPLSHELALHTAASQPVAGRRPGAAQVPGSRVNAFEMLTRRELNSSRLGHFSRAECCHVAQRYLPSTKGSSMIDQMNSRAYIGQFSRDGDFFVGAFQNKSIRVYETNRDFAMVKTIDARNLRWTITDTSLSPRQDFLVYSTISPVVHIVNMANTDTHSIANVTDIHEDLDFSPRTGAGRHAGIWSLEFSQDGREIAAGMGAGDPSLCIYDLEAAKLVVRVRGHSDDVNAIRYADESSHILFSGSDDRLIKVWDRRLLSSLKGKPVGVLLGHTEGVTHIDSKGDGIHLISNGKDQATRLWDVRKMLDEGAAKNAMRQNPFPDFDWDYRAGHYPAVGLDVAHPADCSVHAYRGHQVLETLIRCYFSPAQTTGQRYIYTGSRDCNVYIYDLVSGEIVTRLVGHHGPVRDMSWHPSEPMMISVGWDGMILKWECNRDGNFCTNTRAM